MRHLLKTAFRPALISVVLVVATCGVHGQVQRWTDAQGKVHYGDTPPPPASKDVRTLPQAAPLSSDDKARARANLDRYRDALKAPAPALPASRPAAQAQRPASTPADNSCVAQWRRFLTAWACFDPCRGVNGSLNGDCAARCPEIAQPNCRRPDEFTEDSRRRY